MQYIYQFDIAAIILNSMLLYIIYMRRTYPTKACTIYKGMLVLNLISSCADLTSAFSISFPERFPLWFNYFINITYLGAHNITAICFLLYVIVLVRGNFGTKAERIFWKTVLVFEVLLTTTSPLTHFLFYFDENRVYTHGPFMLVLYICAFSILLYALFLFLRNHKVLNTFQMATNIAFIALLCSAVVFQAIFRDVLIESFCGAISFLMMNVALDNPAMYFYHDTNCFNHTAFDTMLADRLKSEKEFTVIAFTFDDLAIFRKQYGDDAFNRMILRTIHICHEICGHKHVYYLFNDIFAVSDVGNDVDAVIEKINQALSQPYEVQNTSLSMIPHFCLYRHPGEAKTVGDVNLVISDMLTHIYRKTGRHVIWSTSKVLEEKHREDQVIHALHDAIQNDGFCVCYQPIYHAKDKCFHNAEALLRLKDNSLGIYPDEFIPIAEQNGMILDIGEIVLEKVCRFWQENDLAELGMENINVNLSMLQLLRPSAMESLFRISQKYGIQPKHINFEITETATVKAGDDDHIYECIQYLCEKGFTFSLDDYGSGYSNASSLAEMPFNVVKIDKNILWNAMKKKEYHAILESSVSLVRDFKRKCIIEGVETEEMANMLLDLNCYYFQGYLYSRPLFPNDFLQFIREKNGK